jgi:hypothetical protein
MFETRDYRATFFVSLILSSAVHLALFYLVRVEISRGDRDFWRSVTEMRKLFYISAERRPTSVSRALAVIDISEEIEKSDVISSPPVEEIEVMMDSKIETGEATEGETGFVNPFEPDSLDLLFTYPWLFPIEEDQPVLRRLIGLERALRRLRSLERERKEGEEIKLDTKYGDFGISSEGIMLGPIVIPLPLAPFMSSESRYEEQTHEEIQAQSLHKAMKDKDLIEQRERVIEWKKRKEGGG